MGDGGSKSIAQSYKEDVTSIMSSAITNNITQSVVNIGQIQKIAGVNIHISGSSDVSLQSINAKINAQTVTQAVNNTKTSADIASQLKELSKQNTSSDIGPGSASETDFTTIIKKELQAIVKTNSDSLNRVSAIQSQEIRDSDINIDTSTGVALQKQVFKVFSKMGNELANRLVANNIVSMKSDTTAQTTTAAGIGGAVQGAGQGFGIAAEGAGDGINKAAEGVGDGLGKAAKGVGDGIGSALGGIFGGGGIIWIIVLLLGVAGFAYFQSQESEGGFIETYDGPSSYNSPRNAGPWAFTQPRLFSQTGTGLNTFREHPGKHRPPFTLRGGESNDTLPLDNIIGLADRGRKSATSPAASPAPSPEASPAPSPEASPAASPTVVEAPAPIAPLMDVPPVLEEVPGTSDTKMASPPMSPLVRPAPVPDANKPEVPLPDFKDPADSMPEFVQAVMHDPTEYDGRGEFSELIEGGAAWRNGEGGGVKSGRGDIYYDGTPFSTRDMPTVSPENVGAADSAAWFKWPRPMGITSHSPTIYGEYNYPQ